MAIDVFHNTTTKAPKSDDQIVRVDFTQSEIAGRKDHMPAADKNKMNVVHVPNAG